MPLRDPEDALGGLVSGLVAGLTGVAVGTFGPPLLAVTGAAASVVATCWLLGCRSTLPRAGIFSYLVLGTAVLFPITPPGYAPSIGGAILLAAAIAVTVLEVTVRAGATIRALLDGESPRQWRRSGLVLGFVILLWRSDYPERALLGIAPAATILAHGLAIAIGANATVIAVTLVPVALLALVPVVAASTVTVVAPGIAGAPLSGTSPVRHGVTRVAHLLESPTVSPEDSGGAARCAPTSTSDPRTHAESQATGGANERETTTQGNREDPSVASSDDGGVDFPTDSCADDESVPGSASLYESKESDGDSASGRARTGESPPKQRIDSPGAPADTDDGTGVPPCQNCGSTTPDRAQRFVIPAEGLQIVLCPDCQQLRSDAPRSLTDCEWPSLSGAIADEKRCLACGASGSLEAHPVVPPAAGGHKHPNNVLALCSACHEAVEDHHVAQSAPTSGH